MWSCVSTTGPNFDTLAETFYFGKMPNQFQLKCVGLQLFQMELMIVTSNRSIHLDVPFSFHTTKSESSILALKCVRTFHVVQCYACHTQTKYQQIKIASNLSRISHSSSVSHLPRVKSISLFIPFNFIETTICHGNALFVYLLDLCTYAHKH